MASHRPATRELAERDSMGTRVTLLWREGTRKLWVRVHELAHDVTLVIPVEPQSALDAFHHPYVYASHPQANAGAPRAFKARS
jgi:hypothetical protein